MVNSSIEVKENEYIIHLSKSSFDVSFIYRLLTRLQADRSNLIFTKPEKRDDEMIKRINDDSDIAEQYDHLSHK